MKTSLTIFQDYCLNRVLPRPIRFASSRHIPHGRLVSRAAAWLRVAKTKGVVFLGAAMLGAALLPQPLEAANLYWDINGTTIGAGGAAPSGTWDGTATNWSGDSTGNSTTAAWINGSAAVFSAGTEATGSYTITLSGAQTASGLTFEEGTATLSGGGIALNGPGFITANASAKGIVSSAISGSIGLTKAGAGELVLNAANGFTGGLTIRAGTLTLDNDLAASSGGIVLATAAQGASGNVVFRTSAGATLANDFNLQLNGNTVDFAPDSGKTLTLNGIISGGHNWNVNGAGTVRLGGTSPNTFGGNLTVTNGTLLVLKNGALGPSGGNGTTVSAGGSLGFDGGVIYSYSEPISASGTGVSGSGAIKNISANNEFDGPIILTADTAFGADAGYLGLVGAISGGYNLTKVGPGGLDLYTANSYNQTIVSNGTFGVWAPGTAGSGLVSIIAGARLEGDGNAPGGVNLSGTISPGASPATLSSGSQTWNGGAVYEWEVNNAAGTAGSAFDTLNITGGLNIAAATSSKFTVKLFSLEPTFNSSDYADNFDNTAEYNWVIATTTAGITGFDPAKFILDSSSFSNALGGGSFGILTTNSAKDLVLRFDPKPIVTVCTNIVTVNDLGVCGASVSFAITATDNQPGVTYSYKVGGTTVTSPASFSVGTAVVDATATDSVGNTTTTNFTVIVNDTQPPTVVAHNITVQLDANGNAGITAAQVNNGSSDNCGIASITVSPNTFTCANVGPNSVVLTVTDVHGNVASAPAVVTLQDNIAPVAVAQNVSKTLDGAGAATVLAGEVNNGSSDNCTITNYAISKSATGPWTSSLTYGCGETGAQTLYLRVVDASGNESVAVAATATINDTTLPVAVAQNVSKTLDGAGAATVLASEVNNGSSDNCTIANVSISKTATGPWTPSLAYDCTDTGAQTLYLRVVDASENASVVVPATVTISDTTLPVAVAQNVSKTLDGAGAATVLASEVNNGSSDNCTIANVSISKTATGPWTPSLAYDCTETGAQTLYLRVVDASGNESVAASATATISDTTAPVAQSQPATIQLNASGMAALAATQVDNGSSDNCAVTVRELSKDGSTGWATSLNYDCAERGANTVTLRVKDAAGNANTCTATVTVQDQVAPVLTVTPISVTLNAAGEYVLTATDKDNITAGSSDACGIVSKTVTPNTFNFCNVGANPVQVVIADASGNSATNTTTVTMVAPAAPAVVYVDGNYGTSCGPVTFPATGGTGTYYIGYNAFKTIQSGINAVAAGGKVNVAVGNFAESITIDKSLSLLGAQTNVNPVATGRPGGESSISGGYPVAVRASSVTISGFEITGWDQAINAESTGGPAYSGLVVSYNWIHAPTSGGRYGVLLGWWGHAATPPVISGVVITHNIIDGAGNANGEGAGIGLGGGDWDGSNGIDSIYQGIEVSYNDIGNGPGDGIFDGSESSDYQINGMVIKGNYLHQNGGIANMGNIMNGEVTGNLVENGRFTVGIDTGTISGNMFRLGGRLGLWGLDSQNGLEVLPFVRPTANLLICNNDFKDEVSGRGIYLLTDDPFAATIVIRNNAFRNSGIAPVDPPILNDSYYFVLTDSTGRLIVNYGNIDRSSGATVRAQSLNATSNWWGSATGPAGNAGGFYGSVTTSPWIPAYQDDPAKQVAPTTWPLSTVGMTSLPGFWPVSIPDHLVYLLSPGNGSLGVALSPQPVVQVEDSNNNVVTSYQGPIGLAIQYNPGGGILTYTPQNAVNGVATFTDATITVGGGIGYTLTASLPPLSAISAAFDIPNPAPTLTSLNPAGVVTGGGPASVVVSGSSFVPASVVLVNGSPVATAFSSASILTALISTATSGNYSVTVSNPPAAGGVSSPLDFTVGPTPTIVYVDGSYGPGNSGTHSWGYDAFVTIANGIAAVSSGGTVNVAAGTYAGNVVVNKAVTLSGAQHGVDACGRSASESIIESANGGVAVGINVGGVVLNGFKIKNGIVTATGTGISIVNNILTLDAGLLDPGALGATPSAIHLGDVGSTVNVSHNSVNLTGAAAVSGYTTTKLDGQKGWNGGSVGGFTHDSPGDEQVENTQAYQGSQSWHYARGYNSPGAGTPFTRAWSGTVGKPSSGATGDMIVEKFAFKAAGAAGDGSTQNIYEGTVDRGDRTGANIYLENTAGGVVLSMYYGNANSTTNLVLATVSANAWHTVKMTTTYHEDLTQDVTTYVIDEGTVNQITATGITWMHLWRQGNGYTYAPGNSLKFKSGNDGDLSKQGFYYDNIDVVISSSANPTVPLATYSTGFEATPLTSLDGIALRGAATGATLAINNNCLAGADFGLSAGSLQSAGVIVSATAPASSAQVTANTVQGFATGVSSVGASAITLAGNNVSQAAQLVGTTPTIGVALTGVAGPAIPVVQNNVIAGPFYGYLLYALNAGAPTVVQGGVVTGAMQGVAVVNTLNFTTYSPSTFALDGLSLSGFTGNHPANPNNNIQAGVYIFTGGSSPSGKVTGTLTNVTIIGTGKISPDSAGINLADFSTGTGVRQDITIQNSAIATNANRGVFVSGAHAVATITGSSVSGNGFDPFVTGDNWGFGVIARKLSQLTVSNSIVSNPASSTTNVYALDADADTTPQGPTFVAFNNSILNNGNPLGKLAAQSAGTLNASGNWWGDTSDTAIAGLMTGMVDFTPYLASGMDMDTGISGFQGDFSTMYVTPLGAQTGSAERVQEGHDTAKATVIVDAGSYGESVVISKSGFTLKSAQNAGVDARGSRNPESILNTNDVNGVVQIAANNVTVDGLEIGSSSILGVSIGASTSGSSVINNKIGGSGTGAVVAGSATLQRNVILADGPNGVGVWVTGPSASALIQSNNLAGNLEAGIKASAGAAVDAGTCSSAGGNDLSGYGFNNTQPWAVENLNPGGSPAVQAEQNSFGAVVGNNLPSLFSGNVLANQSGGIVVQYPADQAYECLASVPVAATNLAGFVFQGGAVSATAATVSFTDVIASTTPNNRVITRTYTVTDGCGQSANGNQIITVNDTQAPVVTVWPVDRTLDVGGNCSVAVPDLTVEVRDSDNCGAIHISQNPPANTYVSLGVTNVTLTVSDDGGNSTNHIVVLTIVDTRPAPVVTYVDDNYTGLPSGAVVKFPNGGSGADHYIGCDAFATIQGGIDRVATNGTVNVAAGSYAEGLYDYAVGLYIEKPLSLVGPNANINPNTGSRVEEAVITSPFSDGANIYLDLVYLYSDGVVIKGFTFDGANSALPDGDGKVVGGVSVHAYDAIASYEGVGAITLANNIVKNTSYAGLTLYNYWNGGLATTDNHIQDNKLSNIGYPPDGAGIGVILYNNFYADVSSNVMSSIRIGVQTGNYSRANPGATQYQNVSDNTIVCGREGIFHNLAYADASPFTFSNNTIIEWQMPGGETYNREWVGMVFGSIESSVSATAINNTIIGSPSVITTSGKNIGYNIWNTPTTGAIAISGGSVSNVSYGAWVNNWDGYNSQGSSTKATISGVTILGASLAGVYVQDDSRSINGSIVQATVTGNTVIHGSTIGVLVQGTNAAASVVDNSASITGNGIGISVDIGKVLVQNNDLTGNTVAGISVSNGAVVDAGNCGADVTGLGISTGGNNLSGYGFDAAAPWAILNQNPGGLPPVLANHDNFGAVAGDSIPAAFSPGAAVVYSQTPAVLMAPTNLTLVCASTVPAGAMTLADLIAQGGYFSASAASVSSSDDTNFTGSGVITRTYVVTDSCGIATTNAQTIIVSDTIAPTFAIVPSNMVLAADTGECSKSNVTWTVTATDNCLPPGVVSVPPSGSAFNKGTTTVTNIATDASGNVSTATFTVTVNDTQAPIITRCATNETIIANAIAHALLPDLTGQIVAPDNCDSSSLSQIPAAGTSVGLGAHAVTIWAADQSGNSNFCTATVTVIDTTAPVIITPANVTVTTTQAKDPYATGTATATDSNGPVVISYNDDRNGLTGCDTTGNILRTWTAVDAAHNTTNSVQTITVVDDTNATYFTYVPANITATNDPGVCGAVVNYAPTAMNLGWLQGFENGNYVSGDAGNQPSTDWNDSNSHVYRVASGTDGIASKTGSAHAVIDSTIALEDDSTGAFSRLGGYSSVFGTGFRASVDVYLDLTDSTVAANTYGFDIDTAASDQAGGFLRDFIFHAASAANGHILVGADNNTNFAKRGDLATINHYEVAASGWYTFEWNFRATNGVLAVDCNLRDASGNLLWTETRSSPGDSIASVVGGHRYMWFTFITPDRLAIDNTVLERNVPALPNIVSGTQFPVGSTTVTTTATDACGYGTNTTFTVTVLDREQPVIQPIADITVTNSFGICTVPVNYATLMATDNCQVDTIVATPVTGSSFPVGTTPVAVVATDIHGNSTATNFNVRVVDTTATAIASSLNPSIYGNAVTFTATVSGCPASTPTGAVTFSDGVSVLGAAALDGAAQATLTTTNLVVAMHQITASYAGDAYHVASTSGALPQVVNQATLTVTGITANSRAFDGTTNAALNVDGALLNGAVPGDNVALVTGSAVGAFGDENIGTGKLVTISGLTLAGADAFNYALIQPTTTANITSALLMPNITSQDKVYDGNNTATITSRSLAGTIYNSDNVSLTGGTATFDGVTVGSHTVTATGLSLTGADSGNYALTSTSAATTTNITAAGLTVVAGDASRGYGLTNPVFTVSYAGFVNGETNTALGGTLVVSSAADTNSPVGSYPIIASGYSGENYAISYQPGWLTVTNALLTITANDTNKVYGQTVTFAGTEFTASGLVSTDSVSSVTLNSAGAVSNAPVAGSPYSIGITNAVGADGLTNYLITYVAGALTINKADPTITVSPYSVTYNGAPHTATVVATGALNEDLSGDVNLSGTTHTAAGSYPVDAWTFTDVTGNYNNTNGTVADAIGKADPTIVVTAYSVTYNGLPHTAAYTATGVTNEPLAGMDVSGTTHTLAGNYPNDAWTFTDVTGNYNNTNGTVADAIGQATPVVTWSNPADIIYGTALSGTQLNATAAGVAGSLPGGYVYAPMSGTVLNAGNSQTLSVQFTPADTTNYSTPALKTVVINVEKANPIIVVTPYNVIYNGVAHTATGTATGVLNELLAGLALAGTTHTAAGNYSDPWTFTDVTGNYNNTNGTVSDTITLAGLTVVAGDASRGYGLTNPVFTVSYAGFVNGETNTALGGTLVVSSAADTNSPVGSYPIIASGYSGENYAISYQPGWLTVTNALLTITANDTNKVYGQTVTFAGTEFTVSGLVSTDSVSSVTLSSAGAVSNAAVNGGLRYSIAITNAVGDDGLTNYLITYVAGELRINKADPVILVTPYSVTYNGSAHMATGAATGALSENLSGLNLAGTTHTAAGSYPVDAWTFTDVTGNYNNTNGTVADAIGKADPTIVVTAYSVTYNGLPHTAAYTATGVTNEPLAGMDVSGTTHTLAGNYPNDAWTFTDVTGNYNNTNGTVADAIGQVTLTITANDANKVYGTTLTFAGTEFSHGTLYSSDSISVVTLNSSGAASAAVEGNYDIVPGSAVGIGLGNYAIQYVNGTLTVHAAAPVVASLAPVSQTNNASTTASFAVTVEGAASYTNYQWFKITATATNLLTDGGNIAGSTSNTLTLANVLAADQAEYAVTVSNPAGSVTTNGALVVIDPAIFVQPVSVTTNLGNSVSFSVTAHGTSPLSYQWYQDALALVGETGSTLTIASISDSDAGDYSVEVTNSVGYAISDPATLTITHPPVVYIPPASQTVNQGATVLFTVSANGDPIFNYQWRKGGANIPGANGNQYVLFGVTALNDAGSYDVVITNVYGSTTSSPAILTVIVPPAIVTQPVGLTNLAGTSASFSVTTSGTAPVYQWRKNGTNLTDGVNISGSTSNVLTLASIFGADDGDYSLVASNQAGIVTSSSAALLVIDPIITSQPLSRTNNAGTTATFTVSAVGTTPSFQWYKGAAPIPTGTGATLTLNNVQAPDAAAYRVVISNVFGNVTSSNVTLTVIDAPVIVSQPSSLTVNATSNATFTVGYTGTSPSFQWFTNGAVLSGATSATLTLNNVSQANAVDYTVVLTNAAGSVTSSPSAHLTVIDAPVLASLSPVNQTNNATTTAIFTVSATGTTPFSYQWTKITSTATNVLVNGGNISGATTNVLTIANVLAADQATYQVAISNPAGSVTTNGTLVVMDPAILVPPVGVTNIIGSTVTFNVTAVGTTSLGYQWRQNGSPLFGQNASNLVLIAIANSDAGNYTVVVTNSVGSVTSAPAMLVTVPPLITSQPTNVTVIQGQPASFSVSVNGQLPFSYQWQLNSNNILNATNRIYSIAAATNSTDAGSYRVVVVNPQGSQTSSNALLTVIVPPAITQQPANVIAVVGDIVNFHVSATGTPLFYQWHLSNTNLPAATGATLTLNSVTTNNAGTYSVTITNLGGSVTSSNVTLAVYPTLVPTITPLSYVHQQFTLTLAGVPTYNYTIQGSSNLVDWVALVTNVSPYTFVDTNRMDNRFYRGQYKP